MDNSKGNYNKVKIRVHYSWILVFALFTAIVTTQFSADYPLIQRVFLGLATSILFFIATLLREIILSTTTFRGKKTTYKIQLFAYGGVYPESKSRIGTLHLPLLFLARYLANLIIAAVFYGLYATFINTGNLMLAGVAQWLSYIYFLLFLLHFIPAFPLDAGEILRLSIWKRSGDYYRATQLASFIGWISGLIFIFAGTLILINTRQILISLMIILVGWIIFKPAGDTQRHFNTLIGLRHIKVQDLLTQEYPTISAQANIGRLIREDILIKGWRYVIVLEDTKFKGILTLKQIAAVPEKRWNITTVSDVMSPAPKLYIFQPQQTADILFEEMYLRNLHYVPVAEKEKIVGVITLDALKNVVKVRETFKV